MRQLILHIGNHKTGTTAIQDWIAANRDVLASRGVRDLHGPDAPHAHAFLTYIDDNHIFPRGYRLEKPKLFGAALAEMKAEKIIVSSENFSFFFEQAAINTLARAVTPHFDEIKIICYLRRQDRHTVSHHSEGARPDRQPEWLLWGHGFGALPPANELQPLYLDYDKRIAKWERAFGRDCVVLRVYDRGHLIEDDAVVDFCETLGIDRTGCVAPPRSNRSLDRAKSRLGHIVNTLTTEIAVAEALMRGTPNGTEPPRPARGYAKAFLQPYVAGNRALNARYHLTDDPDLFDADFSDFPDRPLLTWTDDDFNSILRGLVTTFVNTTSREAIPLADDLREAAIALAPRRPKRALRLIEAAQKQRPTSVALQEMHKRIKSFLDSGRRGRAPDLSDIKDDPDLPDPPPT